MFKLFVAIFSVFGAVAQQPAPETTPGQKPAAVPEKKGSGTQAKKKAAPAKPVAAAKPAAAPKLEPKASQSPTASDRPVGVPKEAVLAEPNVWKLKDSKGETWYYRRTPFGFAKYQADSGRGPSAADEAKLLSAYDEGENVRFERKTPFGVNKWTRKKSELSGAELEAWKNASGQSASPTTSNSHRSASSDSKGSKE